MQARALTCGASDGTASNYIANPALSSDETRRLKTKKEKKKKPKKEDEGAKKTNETKEEEPRSEGAAATTAAASHDGGKGEQQEGLSPSLHHHYNKTERFRVWAQVKAETQTRKRADTARQREEDRFRHCPLPGRGMSGHQGSHVSASWAEARPSLALARRRLRSFFFVGVSELYAESLCVFGFRAALLKQQQQQQKQQPKQEQEQEQTLPTPAADAAGAAGALRLSSLLPKGCACREPPPPKEKKTSHSEHNWGSSRKKSKKKNTRFFADSSSNNNSSNRSSSNRSSSNRSNSNSNSSSSSSSGRRSSRFHGVTWNARRQSWVVLVRLEDGQRRRFADFKFDEEEAAARKYDEYARLRGKPLNFPTTATKSMTTTSPPTILLTTTSGGGGGLRGLSDSGSGRRPAAAASTTMEATLAAPSFFGSSASSNAGRRLASSRASSPFSSARLSVRTINVHGGSSSSKLHFSARRDLTKALREKIDKLIDVDVELYRTVGNGIESTSGSVERALEWGAFVLSRFFFFSLYAINLQLIGCALSICPQNHERPPTPLPTC
jgi:hypothetical protein